MSDVRTSVDPVLAVILANRLDDICRQMTNTVLRAGRSSVLAMARDFSCSIVTGDNRLLAAAEGLPVHIIGSEFLCEAMTDIHDDVAEGDAFLHNDVYLGNTHAADHTILVPVFVDGWHVFTAVSKAHQADCGNSLATTYMPRARDVYEEGALVFPCVRVQRDFEDIGDVIRMCRARIRVPDIWYGDYLAALGAARVGERALKGLCAKYGLERVLAFIEYWFDYSEHRMAHAIGELPSGEWGGATFNDPFPGFEEGLALRVGISVDSAAGRVTVDLRDNPDCVPAGLNQSRTCAINNAMTGVLNVLDPTIPKNAGSFRRIEVLLRENCVVGIPLHPTCCSMATTNVGDRIVNMTQTAFAGMGDGFGLAEGAVGFPPERGVISGNDARAAGAPYVTQVFIGTSGGPARPDSDGWVTYTVPVGAGLLYRDSAEVLEHKYPIVVREVRVRPDAEGAGRQRGGPGNIASYGPRFDPMMCYYSLDGTHTPPQGVLGGEAAAGCSAYRVTRAGGVVELPEIVGAEALQPGELIGSRAAGGGGYGHPFERDPVSVLKDVTEGYVSVERARDVYGVVLDGDPTRFETLRIDEAATRAVRTGTRT